MFSASATRSQLDRATIYRIHGAQIRETVGEGRAICAISGGVDSCVAATLVHRAIGERLTCVFVNNGVLRKDEFEKVQHNLRTKLGLNIDAVDATERFLSKLAGVTDPERKRKIIGNEFIEVFDEEAQRIKRSSARCSGWCRERFTRM